METPQLTPHQAVEPGEAIKPFPLTAAHIRFAPRERVEQHIMHALKSHHSFPAEVIQSIIARGSEDMFSKSTLQHRPHPKRFWPENSQEGSHLLPPLSEPALTIHDLKNDPSIPPLSRREVNDLLRLGNIAFHATTVAEKQKLITHAMNPEYGVRLLHFIDIKGDPDRNVILSPITDYIAAHADDYEFKLYPFNVNDYFPFAGIHENPTLTDLLVDNLVDLRDQTWLIEHLSTITDPQKRDILLPIVLDRLGFANTVNAVKTILDNGSAPSEQQAVLEYMGRQLFGLDPDDKTITFHTSINSLYSALPDFDTYEPNLEATEAELDMLQTQIEKLAGEKGRPITLVDLGCGTGRIANGLAERDIAGLAKIIAIDGSRENLDKAKAELAQQKASTTAVEYQLEDWEGEWGIPDASVDLLVCIGRSLTHTEKALNLRELFRKMRRKLQPDDKSILFADFPDPNEGLYKANREMLVDRYRSLGVPVDRWGTPEEILRHIEYVADSPDGKNFINRYTPYPETIRDIAQIVELAPKQIATRSIAGWQGSKNMYFTFQRKEEEAATAA